MMLCRPICTGNCEQQGHGYPNLHACLKVHSRMGRLRLLVKNKVSTLVEILEEGTGLAPCLVMPMPVSLLPELRGEFRLEMFDCGSRIDNGSFEISCEWKTVV